MLTLQCTPQGVTHAAGAPRLAFGSRRCSHFAHPLGFEFELVGDQLPPPADWPTLYLQVRAASCIVDIFVQLSPDCLTRPVPTDRSSPKAVSRPGPAQTRCTPATGVWMGQLGAAHDRGIRLGGPGPGPGRHPRRCHVAARPLLPPGALLHVGCLQALQLGACWSDRPLRSGGLVVAGSEGGIVRRLPPADRHRVRTSPSCLHGPSAQPLWLPGSVLWHATGMPPQPDRSYDPKVVEHGGTQGLMVAFASGI